MLIIGAKGFAKELLQIFHDLDTLDNIAFYDDINLDSDSLLFDEFPVLRSENEACIFFKNHGFDFTVGIGNPHLRYKLFKKMVEIGGRYATTISPKAIVGNYGVEIGEGTNILSNAVISNTAKLGKGCLVYYNVVITHDCHVGDFVELSPNAILLGNVQVGSYTSIGSNATILPNVKIGQNVIVGAGSVVTHDIPDNKIVYGVPAKIIKEFII